MVNFIRAVDSNTKAIVAIRIQGLCKLGHDGTFDNWISAAFEHINHPKPWGIHRKNKIFFQCLQVQPPV